MTDYIFTGLVVASLAWIVYLIASGVRDILAPSNDDIDWEP